MSLEIAEIYRIRIRKDFYSLASKLNCINYGACSSVAERAVVVCKTRVRFPPCAFIFRLGNRKGGKR